MIMLAAALAVTAQPRKLAIERIALHQFEDGPVLDAAYELVPGEPVYFSCRLTGYQVQKKGDEQLVRLGWQIRVLDPSGVPIEKPKAGRIEDRVLPQDKDWMPKFISNFVVPPFAPSGVYHIPVTVTDEISGAQIAAELTFHVRGRNVQPSDTLVARNFQFFRSEDDPAPMRVAAYHPGERLWARFDITGYKFGESNRFLVEYGLAVLNAVGEQLFAQPDAASETNQSFYPQHYLPGLLSLSLDPNVARGSYTLVVTVRDKIGNQTSEARQPFQVE